MKVCLISAPTANDFADREMLESDALRLVAEHAPLGILAIAAVIEERGIVPHIIDLNRLYYDWVRSETAAEEKLDFCAFAARHFESLSFDVFGFSTICSSYPLTLRIAREVKRLHPHSTIVLGGPQASVVDVETMKAFPFVDFVVRGEAEDTMPLLLDSLSGRGPHETIPGITFRSGGSIGRNPNAPVIEPLDRLPMPAFHLYPYAQACENFPLELGRGCPFACTFCSTNDFFRRRFRLKSPERVISEMKAIKEKYGIMSFDLVHDMFTVDRKKVVAFCEALIASGEKFVWGCSARTDCIDDELITLMAKAGCGGIFFGIETGSAHLQKVTTKNLDLKEAADRIKFTSKHKIRTAVSLITGFPEETRDDLRDTIHFFVDSLRHDYADPQLCILAPLAETPIETQYRDRLIFDDVISDMSFQGWRQDPTDRDLIKEHPKIFSNFYGIPTLVDRYYLKELREFILNGMSWFKWLLVALHQDSGDLLEVFDDWRAWRAQNDPDHQDENIAPYYAHVRFRQEFMQFLEADYLVNRSKDAGALKAVIQYEKGFGSETNANLFSCDRSVEETEEFKGLLNFDLSPRLKKGVNIIQLDMDFKKLIQCLRRKGRLGRVPANPSVLAIRDTPDDRTEILQLTNASMKLLQLCDGKLSVREIADRFSPQGELIDDVPADAACIIGLEMLRQQGLIAIQV